MKTKTCAHCGIFDVSDDPEIAEQGLCEDCFVEFNRRDQDDFIGYRKGE